MEPVIWHASWPQSLPVDLCCELSLTVDMRRATSARFAVWSCLVHYSNTWQQSDVTEHGAVIIRITAFWLRTLTCLVNQPCPLLLLSVLPLSSSRRGGLTNRIRPLSVTSTMVGQWSSSHGSHHGARRIHTARSGMYYVYGDWTSIGAYCGRHTQTPSDLGKHRAGLFWNRARLSPRTGNCEPWRLYRQEPWRRPVGSSGTSRRVTELTSANKGASALWR